MSSCLAAARLASAGTAKPFKNPSSVLLLLHVLLLRRRRPPALRLPQALAGLATLPDEEARVARQAAAGAMGCSGGRAGLECEAKGVSVQRRGSSGVRGARRGGVRGRGAALLHGDSSVQGGAAQA